MTGLNFVSILFLAIWANQICYSAAKSKPKASLKRKLLIVSFDGFRWNFLQRLPLKNNFSRIIENGAWAPNGIQNVFVTKTYPNHYALASGLYEESSGVVSSTFWDPTLNRTIHLKDPATEKEKNIIFGDPIWATFARQKSPSRVGCYMWAGCNYEYNGIKLTRSPPYNITVPWTQRVDTVLSWFVDDGVDFALLYFPEPDYTCHGHGPESAAATATIHAVNNNLGYLLDKLENKNLLPDLNMIVTADHGFTTVTNWLAVNPDDTLFRITDQKDFFWHIQPLPGKENATVQYLKTFDNITVYRKDEIPARWHYQHSNRIPPLLVVADYGCCLINPKVPPPYYEKGTHGYDNGVHEMWPIFMARGPAFRPNVIAGPDFHTVDVYEVMSGVLGLKPSQNNGSLERAHAIIEPEYLDNGAKDGKQQVSVLLTVIWMTLIWLTV
jgi:ectonucleotide pyrophosphatase/phosphodiesterase family protein 5